MRFCSSFFPFFWHHSIIDKAEAQNVKKCFKLSVKFSYIIGFLQMLHYRQKRTVLLCVFGENTSFHSTYLMKTHNSAFSLNTLYTAKSAQFYSTFRQKQLV